MDILTREDLSTLVEESGEWCISVYLPTHRTGREVQQDPIRFRNLLDEGRGYLLSKGVSAREVRELLGPAERLLSNGLFWQHQGDGLALFLAASRLAYYRLPIDFEPFVLVADRFYVKPLLPMFNTNGRFYVLALSQQRVSLFQGTAYTIGEIDLEHAPAGLAGALRYDDPEKQLQFHTSTRQPGGKGDRPATFHGHGVGVDDQKVDILRYFQQVDKEVRPLLREEHVPLVLAGVGYLFPIYREANTYPHLVDEGIEGSPEALGEKEIHRQAWDIVRPVVVAEQREARDRYQALADTGDERASNDPAAIVSAAHHGRVETLFVATDYHLWGSLDRNANEVQVREEREPGDQDLLDYAAVQVLVNGGTVYALSLEEMPGGGAVSAVFRY